jgi:ribonuclease PH
MRDIGVIEALPLLDQVAAVSCGLYKGHAVLDLDYDEDSAADADANFVMTASGKIVEIQGTAEGEPFTRAQFDDLLKLAEGGIGELLRLQRIALSSD